MADTYFDYILSQCQTQRIREICEVFSTCKALVENAKSGFNGCNNITADFRLFETVKRCLNNYGIIDPNVLGRDALEIYNRCRTVAPSEGRIDYDRLFDLLVDFNWLQASIQNAKNDSSRFIELLSDPIIIRLALKEYLLDVYNGAVQESNECVYIGEAMQARGRIFTGFFPFKHEESRNYAFSNISYLELKSMQQRKRENSYERMSLFFGLTATAALAEDIRRGCANVLR